MNMFIPEISDVKEKEIQIENHEKALDLIEKSNKSSTNLILDEIYFSREKRLEITGKQTAKFYYLLEQVFDGGGTNLIK